MALPPPPDRITAAITALADMDVNRQVTFREGRQYSAARPTNYEAYLAFRVGTIRRPMCEHCEKGYGPFTECVVVAGQIGGSCSNCHYNSEGNRCSFRK